MAEVLRQDGFSFRIRSNDHNPSHVHVFKAEEEAVIDIGDGDTAPSLQKNYNMSRKNAKRALSMVAKNQVYLLGRWRGIHG